MLYSLLKWVHVLSAIIAVGANATYGVWLARAARRPEVLPFTLRTVKLIDDRLANPAYGLLLITGLSMALAGKLPLTTPWLASALALYVVLVLVALLGYTPTLRKQVQLAEAGQVSSPEFAALSRRGTAIGIGLAVVAVAITFLMVVKPALWG